MWVCECSCEKHTIRPFSAKQLIEGQTTSCGCARADTKDAKLRIRDDNNNVTHKKCRICQRMLPISEFYKNKYSYDGYTNECKQCAYESLSSRYGIYRKGAKSRNIEFNLTVEQFDELTSKPCYYCGEYYKQDYFGKKYSGLDRVDSKGGYNIDNVVPCCEYCNRMKLDYTKDFFYNQIQKIYNYWKEKNETVS